MITPYLDAKERAKVRSVFLKAADDRASAISRVHQDGQTEVRQLPRQQDILTERDLTEI
jgi:hypothetical protein